MTDAADIRDWFARWGACVAAVDLDGARPLFRDTVIGMGTYKDMVFGLDALVDGQWRSIWPTIRDFAFELDSLQVLTSPDGRQAVAIILWSSTGIDAGGAPYDRPGRATVVLGRDGERWLGEHTHFSLCPAETQLSFGDGNA